MALQKQTIAFDFGIGGIDQKSDARRTRPIKFAELVDARFAKIGRIETRRAFETYSLTEVSSGSAFSSTVTKLLVSGEQLVAIAPETGASPPKPYRVLPGAGFIDNRVMRNGVSVSSYMPVSQLRVVDCGSSVMLQDTGQLAAGWDRADATEHAAVAYSNGDGQIRVEIYDKDTRSLVRGEATISGYSPRLLAHPDGRSQWILGYTSTTPGSITTTFFFSTFTATTSATAVVGIPSVTDVYNTQYDWRAAQDLTQANSALIFTAYRSTLGNLTIRRATWPGADGSGAALSSTTPYGVDGSARICVCTHHNPSDTTSTFKVVWHEATGTSLTGLVTATFSRTLSIVTAFHRVNSITAAPNRLIGCEVASGNVHIMAEYQGSPNSSDSVGGWVSTPASATAQLWEQWGMGIQSKAMAKSGGEVPYFFAGYSSTGQNTLFLLASTTSVTDSGTFCPPPVVGRMLHTRAFGVMGFAAASPVLNWDGSEFIGIAPSLNRLGFASSNTNAEYSLKELRFSVDGTNGWLSAQNRQEALISGGLMTGYSPVEGVIPAGPQLFPVITVSATTSGSMALGAYAVSGFFEYTDSTGRVRRSAPATPVNFTLTGSQSALIVTAQSYRVGDGLHARNGSLRFVATRTLMNESQVYYRAGSVTNNHFVNDIAVSMTAADATVGAEEPMYTTGGIPENWQPSAPLAIATNGRRYLAVPGDRPNFVMVSKPIKDTEGVHFFEEIGGKSILPYGDRIYALAAFSDRWFAFKKDAIFVAAGDGPDASGKNDTLSEFEPLIVGLGCTAPRSVIVTSVGIVFLSDRGFYLIGSDLTPRYIGADVEDFTSEAKVNLQLLVDACYDPVGTTTDDDGARDGSDLTTHRVGITGERCAFVFRGNGVITSSDSETLVLTIFSTVDGPALYWSKDSRIGGGNTSTIASKPEYNGGRFFAAIGANLVAESNEDSGDQWQSPVDSPALVAITSWIQMGSIQGFGRIYKSSIIGAPSFASNTSATVTVAVGYDYSANFSETHTIQIGAMQNGQFEFAHQRGHCAAVRYRITQTSDTSSPGFMPVQIQATVGVKDVANKLPASARARKT